MRTRGARRQVLQGAALLALLVGVPSPVRASAPALFGLGSEAGALAGAMAARGQGASAGYYNPAALVELHGAEVGVGLLGFRAHLTIDRPLDKPGPRVQTIPEPLGFVVMAAAPVPLRGWMHDRLYAGIALYIVPDEVVRVIAHPPEEPFFPYYDNRTQRLVVLPQLAMRLPAGFSFGTAINFLAGLAGGVVASEGATRAVEARLSEEVIAAASLNAGLRWRSPAGHYAAALVYRERFRVPFSTVTRSFVAGQTLGIDVSAVGLYTPSELVLGGAARVLPWLLLSADLTVGFWSSWEGPWVTVQSDLPLVGPLSAPLPKPAWRDTVSIRIGAELSTPLERWLELRLRAGYGFETSPLPASQPGVTNLLDGNKHIVGAGLGLRFAVAAGTALRLDAHGQLHAVESVTLEKVVAPAGTRPDPVTALRDEGGGTSGNAGFPSIRGGGTVLSAGLMLSVER